MPSPWSDWISDFLTYTEGIPSPDIFRLWSGIGAVAGALERRVWANTANGTIYPNLFTLLVAPPGVGKCLSPDELVLTWDGVAKRAGDVQVGDQLIGPDSKPRAVIETGPGYGPMFEVRPTKGRAWKCNGAHILSLRRSRAPNAGKIKHVTVNEWLTWTPWQKSEWKLWRTGVNEFAHREETPFDPYFIGVLLGDGDRVKEHVVVTTTDDEIVEMLHEVAAYWNMEVSAYGKIRYGIVSHIPKYNPLFRALKLYGFDKACADKYIPDTFKYGSIRVRLQVLAGLLDTDGSYVVHANCYDFISKSKQLADDVVFLARSLGLAAYNKQCQKSCGDFVGTYWRVTVSGEVFLIPCRIPRKMAHERRKQIKSVTNTGFTIIPIGDGPWAGFTVDGDNQYLLDDFTVLHNTQAINCVEELWYGCRKFRIAPNNVTKAALVDALAKADKKIIIPSGLIEYHSLLVPAGEFGVLVPAHDLEFLSVLNYVFDNPRNYREERRSLAKEIDIVHPQLNILAGTQPGFLASLLPEEAWTMGTTSRLIMIYSGEKPHVELFDELTDEERAARDRHRAGQFRGLLAGLSHMSALMGGVQWTREAQVELGRWHRTGCPPIPEHSKLQHYLPRRILHIIKLCMIAAVARTGALVVELEDLSRARDWLLGAEEVMDSIFREMVLRSDAMVMQELHHFLWRMWLKTKKPQHESMLVDFLKNRMPSDKIIRLIEVAERASMIARVAGTEKMYVPRHRNEHGLE